MDFEKPVLELEQKIAEMRSLATGSGMKSLSVEIDRMEKKAEHMRHEVYRNLTAWQKVQIARHPRRPYTLDYVTRLCDSWIELHGDRGFADDHALVGGVASIGGLEVMLIGHQKGRGTKDNLFRNFAMAHPEGYRKALRLMRLAAKFRRPIVTLIDTPGAYPGLGAEERGQAEAIARNLYEMAALPVPIIGVVIGEGGSGGALAISVADEIHMLEYAIYSVISPEGCASILYRDAGQAPQAAESLKLTAPDLLQLKIIDGIIKEPLGGAHNDFDMMTANLKDQIVTSLKRLMPISPGDLTKTRHRKYEKIGFWLT
ncbi:acetyl-CoA carboxylase carboxyltransferase subunit alpha [bacterium]|nr:acetyl-CoA carboxylase carboxyltransferase subunit alpha [bacterium]MBU1983917.1 acetyl-CoA carboxylase carboxyltransferase subunit alpha [bacterium]